MSVRAEEFWFGIVPAAVIFGALCAGLLWALSGLHPITTSDCIRGAHPPIVLEQCAKVQR